MLKTVLALALLLCGGCQPAGALQAPARIKLNVASFPDLDRAAQAAQARWQRLHPEIELKIISRAYADHHTAMSAALATGAGLPDVMALDLRFIGKFSAGRGLLDLNAAPFNAAALKEHFVPYAWAQGLSPGGAFVAMPADIGPGTLLYRPDLLARAGLRVEDLTGSWEQFIEAGRRLKAATGAYLLADSADLRDILLRTGLAEGEGLYFDREGRVLVESPRFVRAFELAREARRAGIDARAFAWSNDWVSGFRQGRIAAQMMGAWLAGQMKNWLAPEAAGKWRSTVLPAGVHASYGGSFYAIPAASPHKQEAWAFIRFMCDDVQTQLDSLRALDSFPALLAAQQDPLFDEPIAYLGGQPARRLWREIAAQVRPLPVHRLDALATDVIRAEYELVLRKGKDVRQALADARRLIEHRMRRRDGGAPS